MSAQGAEVQQKDFFCCCWFVLFCFVVVLNVGIQVLVESRAWCRLHKCFPLRHTQDFELLSLRGDSGPQPSPSERGLLSGLMGTQGIKRDLVSVREQGSTRAQSHGCRRELRMAFTLNGECCGVPVTRGIWIRVGSTPKRRPGQQLGTSWS